MDKLRQWLYILLLGMFVAATIIGCSDQKMETGAAINKAIAIMQPTQGNNTNGVITFIQTEYGVQVVAEISNLEPGEHGFHVHEFGDCSDLDGKSAGSHFNPSSQAHGGPESSEHHMGDLGNITADENGLAHMDRVFSFLNLNGPNSIIGKGLILHAKADDLKSQPTGDAGARLACGVIGIAKP